MEQPPGFVDSRSPSFVCKLQQSFYGLKQAPQAWFDHLSQFLSDIGFYYSRADPSLFVYHSHGTVVLLLIYVDDILITGNENSFIQDLLQ